MINVNYNRTNNEFKVTLDKFHIYKHYELPLTIEFYKLISNELVWEAKLVENGWVTWKGGSTLYNFKIRTASNKLVYTHNFNIERDGDTIEKIIWFYLKELSKSKRPNGLVIGSHDGEFGHWVLPVIRNFTNAIIVDGSKPQLDKCKINYFNKNENQKLKFINDIITTDGRDIKWYTGGEGFTDTTYKPVISKFLNDEQITITRQNSIGINEFIKQEFEVCPDWLHMDVEGIDGDLILALKYYPSLIIFEMEHIQQIQRFKLLDWFQKHNYKLHFDNNNAVAIKNSI